MAVINYGNSVLGGNTNLFKGKAKMEFDISSGELPKIPIDKIDINPKNAEIFTMEQLEALAAEIKHDGFRGGIEVFKGKDGRYELSAGHRRLEAVKLLNWTTIPAIFLPEPEDTLDKERMFYMSNLLTRSLSPLGYAKAYAGYLKDYLIPKKKRDGENYNPVDKLISEMGIGRSQYFRLAGLLSLIPEMQEWVSVPGFPYTMLDGASTLSEEDQKSLYNELSKYITIEDTIIDGAVTKTAEIKISKSQVKVLIKGYKNSDVRSLDEIIKEDEHDKKNEEAIRKIIDAAKVAHANENMNDSPKQDEEPPIPQEDMETTIKKAISNTTDPSVREGSISTKELKEKRAVETKNVELLAIDDILSDCCNMINEVHSETKINNKDNVSGYIVAIRDKLEQIEKLIKE